MWIQRELTLEARPRGFHLVTREVEQAVPEIAEISVGIAHVFIQHTSASLTLNENASPDVRRDFEAWATEASDSAANWSERPSSPSTRARSASSICTVPRPQSAVASSQGSMVRSVGQ